MHKTLAALVLVFGSYALCAQSAETQAIAAQYGQWKVPGFSPNTYYFAPSTCKVAADGSNFSAFTVGTPVTIVDSNPALTEVVTPTAVTVTNALCFIAIAPVHSHNAPFYLTSGTAGLQEAINANTGVGNNVIILDSSWYRQGGTAAMIAAAQGSASLGLMDITTVPTTWYKWSGSQYQAISLSGSGTVTGFSSGSLAPLFTTSVSSPATTPAQSFALGNAINQVFVGTGTATGAWETVPSCSGTNQALSYNNSTQTFGCVTINPGGSAVNSVFGRTGAVVAASGDYTAAQVTNAAAVNAANTFTANQTIASGSALTVSSGASLNLDGITGLTQCLEVNSAGLVSGSGAACGSGSGGGTVTSVGLSMPAFLTVTGSPVTGSGTLAAALASQAANTVFGNFTGSAAAPTFSAAPVFSAANLTNFPLASSSAFGVVECGSGVTCTSGVIAATGTAGVSSLNSLTGALSIAAGSGISVTPSGSTITIANTGGGGSFSASIAGAALTTSGGINFVNSGAQIAFSNPSGENVEANLNGTLPKTNQYPATAYYDDAAPAFANAMTEQGFAVVQAQTLQNGAYTYSADTGTANAYAVALTPSPTVVAGTQFLFKAANANTGASTVTVNGVSYPLTKHGAAALASGDILAGGIYLCVSDGTNMQVMNP